jgi:hypothetical protein
VPASLVPASPRRGGIGLADPPGYAIKNRLTAGSFPGPGAETRAALAKDAPCGARRGPQPRAAIKPTPR